ncbi:MAG: hypothetical protein WC223_13165 [Bacteroidales bacterium]|jgi:hypothetical protein
MYYTCKCGTKLNSEIKNCPICADLENERLRQLKPEVVRTRDRYRKALDRYNLAQRERRAAAKLACGETGA